MLLGEGLSRSEPEDPACDDKRSVRARESFAQRLDGAPVQFGALCELIEIMVERQMDDAIGCFGRLAQAVRIVEAAGARRLPPPPTLAPKSLTEPARRPDGPLR